jgi:proline racemase
LRDRYLCAHGGAARPGTAGIGEDFSHQSIIGSEFVGRLTGTTTVGDRDAVLPTITGRAWITGRSQWMLDDADPFPQGYTVGDIWGPQSREQTAASSEER